MKVVLVSGLLGAGDDRFPGLVSDELVNNGATRLLQILDLAMRLDHVQLYNVQIGFNALLQGLQLSTRVVDVVTSSLSISLFLSPSLSLLVVE